MTGDSYTIAIRLVRISLDNPSFIPRPPVDNSAAHTDVWTAPARWPGCRSCPPSPRDVLPTA